MRWVALLLVGWFCLLGVSSVKAMLPASWWFEPGPILVENAAAGECNRIVYDRQINRPFRASWIVTILRETHSGAFETHRVYQGTNDYVPGTVLPDAPNLCWWTWGSPDLAPGRYRLQTLWTIHIPGGGEREIRRMSNTFEVRGNIG